MQPVDELCNVGPLLEFGRLYHRSMQACMFTLQKGQTWMQRLLNNAMCALLAVWDQPTC